MILFWVLLQNNSTGLKQQQQQQQQQQNNCSKTKSKTWKHEHNLHSRRDICLIVPITMNRLHEHGALK